MFNMMKHLALLLIFINITQSQRIYDFEFSCGQTLPVSDYDLVIKGLSSKTPDIVPTECIITLEARYTDTDYNLEIIIQAIDIKDCSTYLDIFNGKQAYGNYLRRLGCRSMSTDTIYTEYQFATIRLSRPVNLPQNGYIFTFKIRAYKSSDRGVVAARISTGAIVGIIFAIFSIIVVAVLLGWCWRSGRLTDYIGDRDTDDDLEGVNNNAIEKSEKFDSSSFASGIEHQDRAMCITITSGKIDSNAVRRSDGPQYLGRSTYRDATRSKNQNNKYGGVVANSNNGELSATWQKEQTDLKQILNTEILQGQGSRDVDKRPSDHNSKETLIDDVFESDDNKINSRNMSHGGDDAYLKKCDIASEPFKRDDTTRSSNRNGEGSNRMSLQRKVDGSPIRESLRRGEGGRDSNRSTGSQRENQKAAKTLAEEAAGTKLRTNNSRSGPGDKQSTQVDPPSDIDSSNFMSVPEQALIQTKGRPSCPQGGSENLEHDENLLEDSELREINAGAKHGDQDTIGKSHTKNSQESPKSKKKKKQHTKKNKVAENILPPEAFEPLFDRPVSEEPYPDGMQPLNSGYNQYGLPGGMHPIPGYGMPYGMMPAPGTVPLGTQTYAYAYQTMPEPGMPPQHGAGKAAYFVQETPTRNGPVQNTAFMMATTESRPQSQEGNQPHSESTQYWETPHRGGSGQRKSKPRNPTAVIPAGILPSDNGQGRRTAMMKSGIDPNTGIETNQVLWTDTTRDQTDPPLGTNPNVNRKTVTRTTTRSGYGDLPVNKDQITDKLFLQMEPNDPVFLSPSPGGPHALTSSETPERDNVTYYLGLQHRHQGSPQHVIHPSQKRSNAIKDNISVA